MFTRTAFCLIVLSAALALSACSSGPGVPSPSAGAIPPAEPSLQTEETKPAVFTQAEIVATETEAWDSLREPLIEALGPDAEDLFRALDQARAQALQTAIDGYLQSTSLRSRPPGQAQQGISAAGLVSFLPGLLDQIGRNPEIAKEPFASEDTSGEIKSKLDITSSLDGDTLHIQGDLTLSVSNARGTMDETAQLDLVLLVCPDADGRVPLDVTLTMVSTVSTDESIYTEQLTGTGHGTGHVSNDAALEWYSTDVTMERSSQYVEKADASQDENQYAEAATHSEITAGESTAPYQTRVTRTSSQATQAIIDAAVRGAQELLDGLIASAFETASELWQNGHCVEIVLDGASDSNDVEAGSTTQYTARVRHKFEGGELNVPLTADLSGRESLDPTGKREAPVATTYQAPEEEHATASVEYETRSRRGVATKTITFSTGAANYVPVAPPYTWSGVACDMAEPFTLSHTGQSTGSYTITPDDENGGTLTMKQTVGPCEAQASGTYIIEYHGGGNPNADMIMDVHGQMVCAEGVTLPYDTQLRIYFEQSSDPSCK